MLIWTIIVMYSKASNLQLSRAKISSQNLWKLLMLYELIKLILFLDKF